MRAYTFAQAATTLLLSSLSWSLASALPSNDRVEARAVEARVADSGPVAPPDSDPFYQPAPGFEKTAPGTLLRNRTIVANFFNLPDPVQAWQLQYRTSATNGSAITAVTTIFKPQNAVLDRFVSFATAYDASASKCNPSYYYRLGSGASASDHGVTQAEFLIITGYLLQGYIVSSPDYEGPDTAFTPGKLEGQCVLDNMRAVTHFAPAVGFSVLKPAIVGHGYSGGAIATGWAAALQSSYAPELPIKGWAHGGTPANLTGVLLNIDKGANAGYVVAAVVGLIQPSAYQAQLKSLFPRILTAKGKEALQYGKTHCSADNLATYANTSFLSYDFQTIGPTVLQQPALANVLKQCILGAEKSQTPTAPVLVYHSKKDEIIPYSNASSLVDRWCSRGASVSFTSFADGTHVNTAIAGVPIVYTFVGAAFAGLAPKGCSRQTVPVNLFQPQDSKGLLDARVAPIIPGLQEIYDANK